MRAGRTSAATAWIAALLVASVPLFHVKQSQAAPWTERYDAEIRSSVTRWWPDLPQWRLWKAQLWQESRLDPDAVSPVGATGLAQFMSRTWSDVVRELRWPVQSDRKAAALSIEAGAYYAAKLRRSWRRDDRPVIEQHWLGAASYNAGIGNIIRAQRLCDNARLWVAVSPCLPRVTGERNAHETRTYIERIKRWWREMEVAR